MSKFLLSNLLDSLLFAALHEILAGTRRLWVDLKAESWDDFDSKALRGTAERFWVVVVVVVEGEREAN